MTGSKWLRVAFAVAVVVAVHAFGGSAQAAPIDGQKGIVLAGFTSQQYPAFFKVSANARTLTASGIALDMTCTSGSQFVLQDGFARVRISPSGKLHVSVSIPSTAGSNGDTYSGTDSVTAKLGARHTQLSGTWRLQVNYSFTNGMSDQCDSGPVRFSATT